MENKDDRIMNLELEKPKRIKYIRLENFADDLVHLFVTLDFSNKMIIKIVKKDEKIEKRK